MKDVVIRVFTMDDQPLFLSVDRPPELVVDGEMTVLENVKDVAIHWGVVGLSEVRLTMLAKVEIHPASWVNPRRQGKKG